MKTLITAICLTLGLTTQAMALEFIPSPDSSMAKGLYEKGGKERPADPRCQIIRERCAANDRTLALVQKLNVERQDNFLNQQLNGQADQLVKEMSQLSSAAFDHSNAENELGFEGP